MEINIDVYAYFIILTLFSGLGLYKAQLLFFYYKYRDVTPTPTKKWGMLPQVTVQLPVFNEINVIHRLIDKVVQLDYPADKLQIQILDDSTDLTTLEAQKLAAHYRRQGVDITCLHRDNRAGFKAGALAEGLLSATGEFVAIFDADFLPPQDFLLNSIHFFTAAKVGMVQGQWTFLNAEENLLTKVQGMFLSAHFAIEHLARSRSGRFFNFNGTGGIWRRSCIDDAGGWQGDTLTEDMDLSYRAQCLGWKFIYHHTLLVPSELPSDIRGVKAQQYRWSKGMSQVAMKMLPVIWRSSIGFKQKLDASFHLLSNVGYLMTSLLTVVLIPLLTQSNHAIAIWPQKWTFIYIITNFVVLLVYYITPYLPGDRSFWRLCIRATLMIAMGIALSLNGAKGIISALMKRVSPFERTPKNGVLPGTLAVPFYPGQLDYLKKIKLINGLVVFEALVSGLYLLLIVRAFTYQPLYFVGTLLFFSGGYFSLMLYTLHCWISPQQRNRGGGSSKIWNRRGRVWCVLADQIPHHQNRSSRKFPPLN